MVFESSSAPVETELKADIPEDATVTEVRTVTKVQRVIEVSEDGTEKVISKVTETTTKVKEGDEVKETVERKEEGSESEEVSCLWISHLENVDVCSTKLVLFKKLGLRK